MRLTESDYRDLQDWIHASIDALASDGIEIEFRNDLETWAAFQEGLPKEADAIGASRIFDPRRHDLRGRAFWTCATSDGDIVATHCMRVFEVKSDFADEWIYSHNLFQSDPPVLDEWYMPDFRASHRPPSGVITIGGGSWVRPRRRGRGKGIEKKISRVTTSIGRAAGFRSYRPDEHIGLTRETDSPGFLTWMTDVIGFDASQRELMFGENSNYPGRGEPARVEWWWLTPEQIVERARL